MNASAALADDEEPDPLGGYYINSSSDDIINNNNNNDDDHLLAGPNATSPVLSDGVGPTNASAAVAKLLLLTLPEALPVTWFAGQQQLEHQQQQQQQHLQLAYGLNEDGFFSDTTTTTTATTTSSTEFQSGDESTWSQLLSALFYNNSNTTSTNDLQYPATAASNAELEINWFNLILALVLVMLMLTTAIGNLFVIVAILIERNLRTIGNYLVLSLAIADLLVACLVMPLAGIYQILERWTLGILLCDIWTSADVFCCTASILHLLAIALDRYWAVTRVDYIRCQRNERRILFMIFFVWTAALIISLAPVFGWKDADFVIRITKERECLISQDVGYQIFATCTTFYFPLTLTLIFYWKIYQVARKRIRRKPGGRLANQKVSQPNPSTSSSNSAPHLQPSPPAAAGQQTANQRSQQHSNDNHGNKHTTTVVVGVPSEHCACLCHHHQATITGNGTRLKASPNSTQDLAAQIVGPKRADFPAAEEDKCSSVWPGAERIENQKTEQEINLDSTERKNGDNHQAAGDPAPPKAPQCQRQLKQPGGGDGGQVNGATTNSDKGQTGTGAHREDNQILGLSNINACPMVGPQTMEKDVSGRLDYLHRPDPFIGSNGYESSCMNGAPNNIADCDGDAGQSADGDDNRQSSSLSSPMKEANPLAMELNGRGSSLPPNNNGINCDRGPSIADQQQTINGGSKLSEPTEKVVEKDKERSSLLSSKRSSEVSTSTGYGGGGGGVAGGIGAGSSSHTSSLVNYSAYSNDCQHLTSTASAGAATSAIINPSAGAPGQRLMQSSGAARGTNSSNLGGAGGHGGGHLSTGCLDSLDDCCGCCCEPIPAAQSSNDNLTTVSAGQPSASGGGEQNQLIEETNRAVVIVQQQGGLVSSELAGPPPLPLPPPRGELSIRRRHAEESPTSPPNSCDGPRRSFISIINQLGSLFGQVLELVGAKSNRKRLDNEGDGQLKGVLLVANEKGQQQASRLIGIGGTPCTNCNCSNIIDNMTSSYEQQTVRQPTTQLNHHSVHQLNKLNNNKNNNSNSPSQQIHKQQQQQQQQQQQLLLLQQPKGLSTQFQQQQQLKELAAEGLESKRERKAAKTLAIITGVFVICWLPFFVMAITMPLLNLKPHKYIFALLLWLGYVNSMLNPIIYTIFSPDFRKAFKRLLCAINGSAVGGQHETQARRAQRLNQQLQRQRVIATATMRGDKSLDNNNNNNKNNVAAV